MATLKQNLQETETNILNLLHFLPYFQQLIIFSPFLTAWYDSGAYLKPRFRYPRDKLTLLY